MRVEVSEEVVGKEGSNDVFGFSVFDLNGPHPGEEDLDGLAFEMQDGHLFFPGFGMDDVPSKHDLLCLVDFVYFVCLVGFVELGCLVDRS